VHIPKGLVGFIRNSNMLRNCCIFLFFLTSGFFSFGQNYLGQNKDTLSVSISAGPGNSQVVYRLKEGNTFSWRNRPVNDGSFYNMTSWTSTAYTEGYLQGPGAVNSFEFKMNYRLLKPNGLDPNYKPGYPMIVMLHGAGERGNCWGSSCYYGNSGWDPNTDPGAGTDPRLLNNDQNLVHGGQPHLNAVNLAGTKKPNDPTLNSRAFPGFVLFPQNTNGWLGAGDVDNAIRIVRLLIKKYNIDPDRIYVHGLSNGGQATYRALSEADWLFAAAAPMSAISAQGVLEVDSAVTVPIWAFQGGRDNQPKPATTEGIVNDIRKAGGSARYTLYPTLDHGVWNTAYNEPDFFTWLLSKTKRNIHAYYDNPNICSVSGAGAKLALAQGFFAYQWEKDGVLIPGATSDVYIATLPGIYRARFSRLSATPTEAQWNAWSDPVTVSEAPPIKATIEQIGSTILPDINNSSFLYLKSKDDAQYYNWYKNGVLTTTGTIPSENGKVMGFTSVSSGKWTLSTAGFDQCYSPQSDPKYLFFNAATGWYPPTFLGLYSPQNFAAKITSAGSVLLTWTDASNLERNYEVWRRLSTESVWTLAGVVDEDVTSFHDTGLTPNATYQYKMRAINHTQASWYMPGETNGSPYLDVVLGTETNPPTAPENLTATLTHVNEITLNWSPSSDDSGVPKYIVYYGADSVFTYDTAISYVLKNLQINSVYNFTVKAIDPAGNLSAPSNQVKATTYMTGLFYKHTNKVYLNTSSPPLPDIRVVPWDETVTNETVVTTFAPNYSGALANTEGYVLYETVRFKNNGVNYAFVNGSGAIVRYSDGAIIGTTDLKKANGTYSFYAIGLSATVRVDYKWAFQPENTGHVSTFSIAYPPVGPRTQDDYFVDEFEGCLYINTIGNYRFQVVSNDAARLYQDGVIRTQDNTGSTSNSGASQTTTVTTGDLYFGTSGPRRLKVQFLEYDDKDSLVVRYRGPDTGGVYVEIPASALKSGNYTPPATPIAPTNVIATNAGMTQNNLSWNYTGGNPANIKVVVLGSSTAAGTGATSTATSWVGQLTTWLASTTTGSSVVNLAVGGYTSESILPANNPNNNITYALAQNPSIILVNLPSNDVFAGISTATMIANFKTVKALADARGIPLFFTTTQPRNFTNLSDRQLLQTQAGVIKQNFKNYVIDIFDELADIDLNIKSPQYSFGDGVHLNDAGHSYIFTQTQALLSSYLTNFEIYRATAMAGPFTYAGRASSLTFSDTGLNPGTTYYYQVKTVNLNGISVFSTPIVSATTSTDGIAPTAPTALTLLANTTTFQNATLTWNASTDNVKVTGYEIYANGISVGTSTIAAYTVKNLTPNTFYTFTVKAYDASNNFSVASNGVTTTTQAIMQYYSSGGALNQLANWSSNSSGSGGTAPTSFTANGQQFNTRVSNTLSAAWTIEGNTSRIIIPASTTFTVSNELTGTVDLLGDATLILNHATVPNLVTVSQTSTIQYNTPKFIVAKNYGNLVLGGAGYKIFPAGTTQVYGNITASTGVAVRGWPANGSSVALFGNMTLNGTPGYTPPDFGIELIASKNGVQTFTTGTDANLYKITTTASSTLNLLNTGTPVNYLLGSLKGGGLSLATGSTLNVGTNHLQIINAGVVNSGTETGKIAINGSNININSTSALNSNLYFNPTLNVVSRFTQNVTGVGKVFVKETLKIKDALKINNGAFDGGGFATLVSDATGTANIETIEGSGSITGSMIVQRYMAAKGKVYKYISSPVSGVTVANWQNYFPITGDFTGTSIGPGYTTTPSMYLYNEPGGGWLTYPTAGTDNTAPIQRGLGYSAYLRNGDTNFTLQVTGNPYQGNINFPITPDPNPVETNDGWNLVGNPYASTISWGNSGWTKTGINNTIAVKDNPSGQFKYYTYNPLNDSGLGDLTDGIIAPGQAFWVQAEDPGSALTITENAKQVGQGTFYRTNASVTPHLQISLVQNAQEDPAYIAFSEYGTINFDKQVDATKRPNDKINFSTLSNDGVNLAINDIGVVFCAHDILLNVANTPAGAYKIRFEQIGLEQEIGSVILTDLFAGGSVNLIENPEYSFTITADPKSMGTERFRLTISRPQISMVSSVAKEICDDIYVDVTITGTQSGVYYQAYNESDNALSSSIISNGNETIIKVPKASLASGLNKIQIKSWFSGCSPNNLGSYLEFDFAPNPVASAIDTASVCVDSSVNLIATGAPTNGYYNWFRGEELLTGKHEASLEISKVKSEADYFVSAVNASGCEGEKHLIKIIPETVPVPQIDVDATVLNTNAIGTIQWFLNAVALAGETSELITPTVSGEYTVSASVGGCTLVSLPVAYVVTAAEEIDHASFIDIYPNPASSTNLNITFKSIEGMVSLEIINSLGKSFYQNSLSVTSQNNSHRIDTKSTLADGLYLLRVTTKEGIWIKKFIITN
jgi:lysophospholipase L1-like esterase/chitodextrinase